MPPGKGLLLQNRGRLIYRRFYSFTVKFFVASRHAVTNDKYFKRLINKFFTKIEFATKSLRRKGKCTAFFNSCLCAFVETSFLSIAEKTFFFTIPIHTPSKRLLFLPATPFANFYPSLATTLLFQYLLLNPDMQMTSILRV